MKITILCFSMMLALSSCDVVTSPLPPSSIWPSGVIGNSIELSLIPPDRFDGSMPISIAVLKQYPHPTYRATFQNGDVVEGRVAFWQQSNGLPEQLGMVFQIPSNWASDSHATMGQDSAGIVVFAGFETDALTKDAKVIVRRLSCRDLKSRASRERSELQATEKAAGNPTCEVPTATVASLMGSDIEALAGEAFVYMPTAAKSSR